jgi:hypothetical protein
VRSFSTTLKAGPAGGRLRRPSSAGSITVHRPAKPPAASVELGMKRPLIPLQVTPKVMHTSTVRRERQPRTEGDGWLPVPLELLFQPLAARLVEPGFDAECVDLVVE